MRANVLVYAILLYRVSGAFAPFNTDIVQQEKHCYKSCIHYSRTLSMVHCFNCILSKLLQNYIC